MKNILFFTFFALAISTYAQDQNWVLPNYATNVLSALNMSFVNGNNSPNLTLIPTIIRTDAASACISSPSGKLLFYTNGKKIVDAAINDSMTNGNGLGIDYWSNQDDTAGVIAPQGVLILPSPKDTNEYYVFYERTKLLVTPTSAHSISDTFFYAKVNYPIGGGTGEVTAKDIVLATKDMVPGGITACKHGNGKDWWIVKSGLNTDENYFFLLTESGVDTIQTQLLGNNMNNMKGSGMAAAFSPDGSKYIKSPDSLGRVIIYDFDRCTGNLSNLKVAAPSISTNSNLCTAVSPNSRFAYAIVYNGTIYGGKIIQIDLLAANPTNSIKIIITNDIYPTVGEQSSIYSFNMATAPDGKIYIGSGDGILHIIHEPDSEGVACQLEMRALNTPSFTTPNFPNMPNYRLGVKRGSICDTILSNQSSIIQGENMRIYPNPTQNELALYLPQTFVQSTQLIFIDVMGNVAKKVTLAPDTKEYILSVNDLSAGIYQVQLQSEGIIRFSQKLVIAP